MEYLIIAAGIVFGGWLMYGLGHANGRLEGYNQAIEDVKNIKSDLDNWSM